MKVIYIENSNFRFNVLLNDDKWTLVNMGNERIYYYKPIIQLKEEKYQKRIGLPLIKINKKKNYLYIYSGSISYAEIFYRIDGDIITISDGVNSMHKSDDIVLNDKLLEMLCFKYTLGNETAIKDIYYLQSGEELILLDGVFSVTEKYYYNNDGIELDDSIETLYDISIELYNGYRGELKNKTIIVPLSGGLDSRLIASMLKTCNYENVICLCYGVRENWESKISKKVANALDYEWIFVEYDETTYIDKMDDTLKFIKNHNYYHTPCIQELPSTRSIYSSLCERDEDFVFLPGHTGDFLSGGHIPTNIRQIDSLNDIKKYILSKHITSYLYYPIEKIENLIYKYIQKIPYYNEPYKLIEYYDWKERQSKFIIKACRAYEFYNCKWITPLWSKPYLDYFSNISLNSKLNKKKYKTFLYDAVFNQYGLSFDKDDKSKTILHDGLYNLTRNKVKKILKKMSIYKYINKKPYYKNACGFDRSFPLLYESYFENRNDVLLSHLKDDLKLYNKTNDINVYESEIIVDMILNS